MVGGAKRIVKSFQEFSRAAAGSGPGPEGGKYLSSRVAVKPEPSPGGR